MTKCNYKETPAYSISPMLYKILKTKRPTNNLKQNTDFMQWILKRNGIMTYVMDSMGNITVEVPKPDGTRSQMAFTAHTDTMDNKVGDNDLHISEDGVVSVLGGGVLGADDGAGIYILLEMILEHVPGRYIFFATEEQGRIGSQVYAMPSHVKAVVSFDRKGTDNLITHQMSERGCSDEFADALIAQFAGCGLRYIKDPTGSFTDSYSFFTTVPECINLSCGYYNQHTKMESLDSIFLEDLADAVCEMDWESLPIKRDPSKVEYDWGMVDNKWGGWTTGNKKANPDLFWGNTPEDETELALGDTPDLLELCIDYPDIAATLLSEYGITERDFMDFGGVR